MCEGYARLLCDVQQNSERERVERSTINPRSSTWSSHIYGTRLTTVSSSSSATADAETDAHPWCSDLSITLREYPVIGIHTNTAVHVSTCRCPLTVNSSRDPSRQCTDTDQSLSIFYISPRAAPSSPRAPQHIAPA